MDAMGIWLLFCLDLMSGCKIVSPSNRRLEVTGPKARPTLLTVELDADSPLEVGNGWCLVGWFIGIGSLVD